MHMVLFFLLFSASSALLTEIWTFVLKMSGLPLELGEA
jgi:hypothetical protein